MILNPSIPDLKGLFSFLEKQDEVQRIQIPAGTQVGQSGELCESLALVLKGQVKVYRPAVSGRSLTLYYINQNESCILTASSILNNMPLPAFAETVSDVEALTIPPAQVKQWLVHEPLWQEFVFSLLSQRMVSLIDLVNALAFQSLDARLAVWILSQSTDEDGIIKTTHQQIAEELASSREVISRLLKEFELDNSIKLGRGYIQLIDKEALKYHC